MLVILVKNLQLMGRLSTAMQLMKFHCSYRTAVFGLSICCFNRDGSNLIRCCVLATARVVYDQDVAYCLYCLLSLYNDK